MNQVWEVFWRFLLLGCTSFGGPAAHLGYFQKTFVQENKWIDQEAYARLISLSQFLPGPGSSQVGFALGLRRAGLAGGIAAFLGFTLPSFLILYFLAVMNIQGEDSIITAVVHGLKLLAVVIVADAVLNMQRSFCKETSALYIAIFTAVALLLAPGLWTQMSILLLAAGAGILLYKGEIKTIEKPIKANKLPLITFLVLFLLLPLLAMMSDWAALFSAFYQAGSLVFGGGHVVLPLLQQSIGEAISPDRFILGYAAAQAIPGPMFTLATFLGADMMENLPLLGAIIATLGVFLPGFLLILSLQGAWESLAHQSKVAGAVWGINAAVVGLLLAALYQPVFISTVSSPADMAAVIIGFFILQRFKPPILLLVAGFALMGILLR
ncbi:chromate efflux transporter [Neptuniibacter sp.]|uniref:chromate efflux transporter n=1 Tax=Neptuniibacter sp. TaxID=1962643 RepID=UPI0026311410|nr:chromate efflux transporter [Neptuniibacter sp.]MCP4596995.1 chromate efflux transporter [Neptuniibacter sp.]